MNGSRLFWALGTIGLLSVALHCGSSSGSTFFEPLGGPCESLYSDLCGTPCATNEECPDGLFCTAQGACGAECSSEHPCPNNLSCTAKGQCIGDNPTIGGNVPEAGIPDSELPDSVCADVNVALAKVLPKVLFLLDQSASMRYAKFPSGESSNNCNPDCRWTVLKDVLIGPDDNQGGLIKQLEGDALLAVKLYSATDPVDGDGDDSHLVGETDNVCPRFNGKAFDGLSFKVNAFEDVNAMLRPATVDDDTPTGPAIRTVVGLGPDGGIGDTRGFAAIETTAPKVIVLVTDGEPAVCGENYASEQGRQEVISAVQQTFVHGIRTFVIAIGDVHAAAHFNEVANAGQGLDPQTGDAGAILPSSEQQLIDALRKIVLDARTCTFDLNGEVQPGMEERGVVKLNGNVLPLVKSGGPEEGWRLVNPSRIELVGSACETLKTSEDAELSAQFPCNAVVPIGIK